MKKIFFVAAILLAAIVWACSTETEKNESLVENEMIAKGKKLGSIHNDGLAAVYKGLEALQTTRSEKISFDSPTFRQDVVDLANEYIKEHSDILVSGDELIDVSLYDMSISEIRAKMSDRELFYVDATLDESSDKDELLKQVLDDKELDNDKKQAVICFITTYQASSEYWSQNMDDWLDLTGLQKTRLKWSWRDAVSSDAYWGYTGMLMSFNLYVAGGVALGGSIMGGLK